MNIITWLEEAILIAVWRLKDNAYGVTINKHVFKSLKKSYSMGALYFSLGQLHRKGYVRKATKQFYHKKGGRSRTYYNLADDGKKAVQEIKVYQKSLWQRISEVEFELKKSR